MTAERRTSSRRKVTLAAEIDTPDGPRTIAVCRDASDRGLLLLTHVAPPVGSTFSVAIVRPSGGAPITFSGRVVRCAPLELELADVWSFRVGVEVLDPPPELALMLDEIGAAAAG